MRGQPHLDGEAEMLLSLGLEGLRVALSVESFQGQRRPGDRVAQPAGRFQVQIAYELKPCGAVPRGLLHVGDVMAAGFPVDVVGGEPRAALAEERDVHVVAEEPGPAQ